MAVYNSDVQFKDNKREMLTRESTVLEPCDYGRRDPGGPGQGRGSCQLAEAEKCNRDSQLPLIGQLL